MNDEIITEVHAVKDALSKRFKGDVKAIFEDIEKWKRSCVPAG